MTEQALSGTRVLEVESGIAGAYACALMSGLGAEVLKVEPPAGDWTRRAGPFPGDVPHVEKSALFLYINQGKKSITLDVETRVGQRLLRSLAEASDMLVEGAPPGWLDSFGLGYETLEALNPGLIVVSITGFGQTGPYRGYQATQLVVNAMCGLMATTGDPDREPLSPGGWSTECHVGTQAFSAALIALYGRQMNGRGQRVDVSALEAMIVSSENAPTNWAYNHEIERRSTNVSRQGASGIFPCADGFVSIDTVIGDFASFQRLATVTGITEFSDPAYADPAYRAAHAEEINALLRPWIAARTKEEVYHAGQAQRLPFGYVCTVKDLLESSHLKERRFFTDVEHPLVGRLAYPGAPFVMSETPWQSQRAPLLGEHNTEVFCARLGLGRDELARLHEQGVV